MSAAAPMTTAARLVMYGGQETTETDEQDRPVVVYTGVTPAQNRRLVTKERHANAWQDRRPRKPRRHDLAHLTALWDAHWRKPEPPVPSENQLDRIAFTVRRTAPRNIRVTWPKRYGRRG